MNALLFAFDGSFVLVEFVIGDIVERIFGIRCLVYGSIVLEIALDDAFGSCSYQYYMISSGTYGGVFDTIGLVPSDTFQYM